MNFILFDDSTRKNLFPLTFTRPVAEIRIGILTIREKWEKYLNKPLSTITEDYLQKKFPLVLGNNNTFINGSFCPDETLFNEISELQPNQALVNGNILIAINSPEIPDFQNGEMLPGVRRINSEAKPFRLQNLWDIFSFNGEQLIADFKLLTRDKESQSISSSNQVINPGNIFIEQGANVECAILNASTGPIYIGRDAEIMEGCIVRGPFALCEHATLKMGAKIYGPTTVGPRSKVGGEVNNSVIQGFSNKGHDGFLGNSVIGEWCNIGADSNNSNLKNNYADVKLWSYEKERFVNTGLQFCGLIMGDHSKCGINTMFNTGTVIGVNANIFGSGFPRNFVPSFSWGGASGFITYKLNDAIDVAEKVFERRGLKFDQTEKDILLKVFELTEKFRK